MQFKNSIQQLPNFNSKNMNSRSSNAGVMCYDMKIRMLSRVMIMNEFISNKQITQMNKLRTIALNMKHPVCKVK